jgi:hypothetical protein
MRIRLLFLDMIGTFNLNTLQLLWGQETLEEGKCVAFELWKQQYCLMDRTVYFV